MASSCSAEVSEPISKEKSYAAPSVTSPAARANAATNSSYRDSWTKIRSMPMQIWPALEKHAWTAPVTAASRSASARTTIGFLPPSSIEAPISRRPQAAASSRPVAVEPVNARWSTSSSSAGPITEPRPATTCQTSSGSPARAASSRAASSDSGACESALLTTALPAISAGITSPTARKSG